MCLIVFCVPAHFARTPEFDSASHASHALGERLELFIAQGFHGWPARILCCYISCCAAAVESSDDFLFFTSMWQSSIFEFSACGRRGMSATAKMLPVIRAVFALGVHAFLLVLARASMFWQKERLLCVLFCMTAQSFERS